MSHAIPLRRPAAITSEIVRLTPSDARRLLDVNTHNRPLTERDIFKWASEMEAGRWQLNGEALKISENNTILDGQHRLEALALQPEGTAIEFLIIRGLPSESQSTMDQGRKRSPSDQLNLAGIEADKSLAAAIRIYLMWVDDLLFTDNRAVSAAMTTTKIVQWSQGNPDTVDLMRRGLTFRRVKARMGLVAAIYARIAQAEDVDAADMFFQRVQDGLDLSVGSPILALRANHRLFRNSLQLMVDR